MLLLDEKNRWIVLVETAILLSGIFFENGICQTLGTNETCQLKNTLFISVRKPHQSPFPSKAVYHNGVNGTKLCFDISGNNKYSGCCHSGDFDCTYQIQKHGDNEHTLILNDTTLSKQDIVLIKVPDHNYNCMPSSFTESDFLFNIHKCLNTGNRNIRLSQNHTCGWSIHEENCTGLTGIRYKITEKEIFCVSCKPRRNISLIPSNSYNGSSLDNAVNIMNNLSSLLEKLGNDKEAHITIGDIKGVITKLFHTDQTDINVGITTSGDVSFLSGNNLGTGLSGLVHIPTEATTTALKRNGSFAGVLLFPNIHQSDSTSTFLNNEMMGIDMGTQISNLSDTIDIHYKNVNKDGKIASCKSWDGKGKEATWITDGCLTNETDDDIKCHCSHLTFFAVLMSPPPQNISASDFTALTYITSIGCGISIFFLKVGLCMHCFIRKGKASQATKILMNLFGAMLMLNLCFLINEVIANLDNFGACVAIAAAMHYTMLATFSWFFIEALHLYFSLWKIPTEIKHYMMKIYITGWVSPAIVVVALAASQKYNYLVIYTDDGNSAKMCWIPDAIIHQGVNIGYYAIVFIFTFVIFIITVRQIVMLKPTEEKAKDVTTIKTNSFSILGLFLLLGLTWAFAFFSHGPLRIPSYYIFTVLNSFQGFLLFIYYYNSSKVVGDEKKVTASSSSSSSSATSNTVLTSPYK